MQIWQLSSFLDTLLPFGHSLYKNWQIWLINQKGEQKKAIIRSWSYKPKFMLHECFCLLSNFVNFQFSIIGLMDICLPVWQRQVYPLGEFASWQIPPLSQGREVHVSHSVMPWDVTGWWEGEMSSCLEPTITCDKNQHKMLQVEI